MSRLPRTAGSPASGFAVQLGTVRAVGRFLEDPLDVPWPAVEFLADQLAIGDASCVKKYVQRSQTPYEHAWEIRDRYGYRSFDDQSCAEAFVRFLDGRAWTHAEGPVALFEHATGWLRRNRVLLPGVTVLARQVAAAREAPVWAARPRRWLGWASRSGPDQLSPSARPSTPPRAHPVLNCAVASGAAVPVPTCRPPRRGRRPVRRVGAGRRREGRPGNRSCRAFGCRRPGDGAAVRGVDRLVRRPNGFRAGWSCRETQRHIGGHAIRQLPDEVGGP